MLKGSNVCSRNCTIYYFMKNVYIGEKSTNCIICIKFILQSWDKNILTSLYSYRNYKVRHERLRLQLSELAILLLAFYCIQQCLAISLISLMFLRSYVYCSIINARVIVSLTICCVTKMKSSLAILYFFFKGSY